MFKLKPIDDDTRLWPEQAAPLALIPEWVVLAWIRDGVLGKDSGNPTKDIARKFTVSINELRAIARERSDELAWAKRVGEKTFRKKRGDAPWGAR